MEPRQYWHGSTNTATTRHPPDQTRLNPPPEPDQPAPETDQPSPEPDQSAALMASTLAFASPSSMSVFSWKNSGFCTPA